MVLSLLWINSAIVSNVYAQVPGAQNSKTLAVKITTPNRNQSVPAGSNLDISGSSLLTLHQIVLLELLLTAKSPIKMSQQLVLVVQMITPNGITNLLPSIL